MKQKDLNALIARMTAGIKKYKFVLLIAAIGVVLLLLPSGKGDSTQDTASTQQSETQNVNALEYAEALEQRLTRLLMQVDGAGRVSVLLTLQNSGRTLYQSDIQSETDGTTTRREEKTVILSRSGSYNEAAITAVLYPGFQGALIVCEGADSAAVRLSIINAVAALTGLSTEKITVVKMK